MKTSILNKLNHKPQSHARACNENKSKKKRLPVTFINPKYQLLVVVVDDARRGSKRNLQH